MHLVTTALREFWPERGPIWLLTPGCLPAPVDPEVAKRWDIKGTVGDPWRTEPKMTAAYADIWSITQELIGILAGRLNVIHNTDHSERYWRTHIGFWALLFVTTVYDRHARLLKARSEIDHVEVIGRTDANLITPSDTIDFAHEAADDLFSCQLYTLLCNKLEIPIVEYRAEKSPSRPEKVIEIKPSIAKHCLRSVMKIGYAALSSAFARRADVLMVASYLPRWFEIELSLVTWGKVFRLPPQIPVEGSSNSQVDNITRSALSAVPEGCEGIRALVIEMVKMCIPKALVEDYRQVCSVSDRAYKRYQPKAIYSATAWWFDEPFKHWAADCQEHGTKLIGGAHGSAYFVRKHSNPESFEVLLSDCYLTWGWSAPEEPKLVPTPACKLTDIVRRPSHISGDGILYGGTAESRHSVMFLANFSDYLEWQQLFFANIPEPLIQKFLVRLHFTDLRWRIRERLLQVFPNLLFDSWDVSFRDRLKRCRLYVCDHLSTTYAEALAANVPTILFWDETRYPIRETARPYIEALKDCHILHDTPVSAAAWVSKIYDDPASWWLSDSCQKAVRDFCYLYARTSTTALQDWKRIFKSLAIR